EAEDVVEKVAYVACNGRCDVVAKKYDYVGEKSCRIANMAYSGDRFCSYACLGYGDCVAVCPRDAISIEDGVARVDPRKCIGCGLCARTCPNGIIHLVNDTTRVVVECSNHDKGAATRKYCTNGCIGCGKCQKNCEAGAITVQNNLAVIDYEKCTNCGKCAEVCPVKCIHEGNFICGAHF
ncbi:MAG: 4Fe-4S binding protein, partial [Clostridia bacterium]|nr:4Fe-4S binding protein [Clostridia bacterium]